MALNINDIFCPEIFVKHIFRCLSYDDLINAMLTCKKWKAWVQMVYKVDQRIKYNVAIRNSIFISGGTNGPTVSRGFEVLGKYTYKIKSLKDDNFGHSMVINNSDELIVLGGLNFSPSDISKICLVYRNNEWIHHSTMLRGRIYSSSIVMPEGIYVFGGKGSHVSCEFLPNGKLHWSILETEIPKPGLLMASCVAISPFKIVFTGGVGLTQRRIMTFDTKTMSWEIDGELIHGRWGHASFIFNGRIIITGGKNERGERGYLTSTEILELKPRKLKEGGRLNDPRHGHGIGVVNINNAQKLVVFGGWSFNQVLLTSVEAWDDDRECWERTDLQMPHGLSHFAYCSKSEPSELL